MSYWVKEIATGVFLGLTGWSALGVGVLLLVARLRK